MVYLLAKATNFLLYDDDDCYCYTTFLFRLCRFVEPFQPDGTVGIQKYKMKGKKGQTQRMEKRERESDI